MPTRGRNRPQQVVPLTPILDGDDNKSLAKWAKAMTALNEELTVTLQQAFSELRRTVSYNVNVTADYITTGEFLHETVICNNTGVVVVTLQTLSPGDRVTVIRAGTGAVTVDGDTSNIIGSSTKVIAAQYDALDLIASATEWVLR
jgi:hypothetical protein